MYLKDLKSIFLACFFLIMLNGIAEGKKIKIFLKPSPYIAENAKLKIAYKQEKTFFEGPVWNPADSKLYFTYFSRSGKPSTKVVSLSENGDFEVFYNNSQGINGMFLAQDGSLLGAQYKTHKVIKLKKNKKNQAVLSVIAENANWFQPNDICQANNGDIYFSDPDFKKKEGSAVYLLRKGHSKAVKVATNFKISNGLIVSKNQKNLIVADSFLKQWKSFKIKKDGTLGKGKIFFSPKKNTK